MWKGPKSPVDAPDGVEQDNSGEAVPAFRRELPEDGQELLEQTLTNEGSEILASDKYDDDTDTDESNLEADHDFEAAYQHDNEQESSQEDEEHDADSVSSHYNNEDEDEGEDDDDEGGEEEAGYLPRDGESDEEAAKAVEEFESRWQEAISSSEVLVLDEHEVDPNTVFEAVKVHFGEAYGAPSRARNKRNSNELVGKKALKKSSPRLDPSVLDRVPKDPSGLLQIDELAKLLAP